MESECCQFGHGDKTTALSSISSDRPIRADANTQAQQQWTDTREFGQCGTVRGIHAMKQSTGTTLTSVFSSYVRRAGAHITGGQQRAHFTRCLLKHITNLRPQGERHLCFISVHALFPSGHFFATERKLNHQNPCDYPKYNYIQLTYSIKNKLSWWRCNWYS